LPKEQRTDNEHRDACGQNSADLNSGGLRLVKQGIAVPRDNQSHRIQLGGKPHFFGDSVRGIQNRREVKPKKHDNL